MNDIILRSKTIAELRNMVAIQGDHGNWNYDAYMHGMFNGMELMLATIEDREVEYKDAPDNWLSDNKSEEGGDNKSEEGGGSRSLYK